VTGEYADLSAEKYNLVWTAERQLKLQIKAMYSFSWLTMNSVMSCST